MEQIPYYAALADIGSLVAGSPDLPELFQNACEHIVSRTGSTGAYIATIASGPSARVEVPAFAGPASAYIKSLDISVDPARPGGHGMVGHVHREGTSLSSNDCLHDPRFEGLRGLLTRWNIRSAAGVPIVIDGQSRGVLVVAAGSPGHYNDVLLSLLERIAQVLAVGMDRAEQRARGARYRTLYAIQSEVNALIARGPEPQRLYEATCRIVAGASRQLRAYIGCVDREAEQIRLVACGGHGLDDDLARAVLETPLSTRADDPSGQGISGATFRAGRTVLWPNIERSAETWLRTTLRRRTTTRSLLGIPVTLEGECRVVLVLACSVPGFFDDEFVAISEQVAGSLGVALEAYEQRQSLRKMALTDALTGLPNRTLFSDRLRVATARADREGGELVIALIDLDNFKEVNTRFGHDLGDGVLSQMAKRLSVPLRESDTLARLGGDEFAALLPMQEAALNADSVLSRILGTLADPFAIGEEQVAMHASVGVAIYPRDGRSPEDLLRRADLAMYRVKSRGGNSWALFEQDLEHELRRRFQLKAGFLDALQQGEILFHYQPVVELRTGRIVGAEALARWNDPGRGLLPPGQWVDVIEGNTRLIAALGRHALASAMRQLSVWHNVGDRLSLSVNIGVRHLLSGDFLADLRAALAVAPQLASYLVLEITETALIDDFAKVAAVLSQCHRLGVQIALDDFGTGQASLTYLLELPADRLKIDHTFVIRMLSGFRAFGIVAAATQGTQMLGMPAVAEGVETEEHGLRLIQLGCDYAQGFAVAPGMPPDAFDAWRGRWVPPSAWKTARTQPIDQKQTQVLASLMLHRERRERLPGPENREVELETLYNTWKLYCPVRGRVAQYAADPAYQELARLDQQLHEAEERCLEQLTLTGAPAKDVLQAVQQQLRLYESHVGRLLDRAHGVRYH